MSISISVKWFDKTDDTVRCQIHHSFGEQRETSYSVEVSLINATITKHVKTETLSTLLNERTYKIREKRL